ASGLNLSVGPGDVLLLTGPNGSGKTSILRALAGLLDISAGDVECTAAFHWLSAQGLSASAQNAGDYLKTQTSLQNEDFALRHDAFEVGEKLDTSLSRLSTGWRQRVKLTRLTLMHRPLWLLDEPSDGLDETGLKTLTYLLEQHRKNGGAAIIATHQPDIWPKDAKRLALGAT
ncbi:MAG TPA: ATP-binding cassette domain-containing protein, partial [Alphaproteobacteria bacterium]